MAKKPGNLLIKVAVLIALAAAVFFALDSWRKQPAGDQAADTTGPDTAKPGLSREEAERIGTEIGTRIGTEIGTQIGREVAAEMLAERQAQLAAASTPPAVAGPAPEPVEEPAPSVEPPAPADTPAATAPAETETPAPKPKRRETRAQGTIPGTPIAQPASGRDPWWIKSNTGEPDALALTYAGNFKSSDGSQRGIALMFSGRFDSQTDFASYISVTGGSDVSGQWRLGANLGLVYLPGVPSGSYTVTVKSGFKDADGKTLKSDVSGPVDVR
jgi:hypothetical protein